MIINFNEKNDFDKIEVDKLGLLNKENIKLAHFFLLFYIN
jgi:hypothetical protein